MMVNETPRISSLPTANISSSKEKVSPRSHFRGHTLKKIPQQAMDVKSGLVKTKKVADELIEVSSGLESKGRTSNHVFIIGDNNDTVGFLKIGNRGFSASAIMERLVWEIASIFDVQEVFSPTTEMDINQNKARKLSVEVAEVNIFKQTRYKRYSLDAISEAPSFKGSFQIAEKGTLLTKIIEEGHCLNSINPNEQEVMNNLIQAVVTSLGFGMMDAHTDNIFVTKDANYKFIDNARCFPHSNSVYASCGYISLSYRCGLLELSECHKKLTHVQKNFMVNVIEKFKNKLSAFEEFLRAEDVKKRIDELPLGWFDTEKIIKTTRERIELLHIAARGENMNSLVDLVFETVPYYRLFSILYLIREKVFEENCEERFWRTATAGASLITLNDGLILCGQNELNPYTLAGLSMQKKITFSMIHSELKQLIASKTNVIIRDTVFNFALQFYDMANVDLKDVPLNNVKEGLKLHLEDGLLVADIPIETDVSELPYYVETDDDPFRLIINFPDESSRIFPLDIYSFPGLIKIDEFPDLPPMKIPDFKAWIDTQVKEL